MRTARTSWARLVAGLFFFLPATPAAADDVGEAKALFDEGAKAFVQRRYAEAADAYERAASASPHPAPLINAAEAWELDGNFVRAARDCDAAQRLTTEAAVLEQIERRLTRLTRRIATLEVDGPATLKVRVDDAASVALPSRLRLSPGAHSVVLVDAADGETRARDVVLGEGETRHLVLTKATWEAPPATPHPVSSSHGPPLATWIGLGVGAAAGAGAGIFGALTLGAQSDFEAHPTTANADRFDRNLVVTNVLVGATAVAIVVAGAFWILSPKSGASSASAAHLTPLRFTF